MTLGFTCSCLQIYILKYLIGPSFLYSSWITCDEAFSLAVFFLPHLNMFLKLECKAAILNNELIVYTEKCVQPFQLPIALDKCKIVTFQCSISHLVITHQTEHIGIDWQCPVGDWQRQQQNMSFYWPGHLARKNETLIMWTNWKNHIYISV